LITQKLAQNVVLFRRVGSADEEWKAGPSNLSWRWIKQRRKTLDLTQEGLVQRAGCSVFALRKIEFGERRPSRQLAELMADALDFGRRQTGFLPDDAQLPGSRPLSRHPV
jgi:DNA-binding XRE family transcriptional regulator